MHDILYENQQALDHYHLVEYASMLDLDVERFNNDSFSHTYAGHIHEDFISGVRSGVNGTPTFFINGTRYDGPLNYQPILENLMYIVEQEERL
jgi:protein-disulfide isomerase